MSTLPIGHSKEMHLKALLTVSRAYRAVSESVCSIMHGLITVVQCKRSGLMGSLIVARKTLCAFLNPSRFSIVRVHGVTLYNSFPFLHHCKVGQTGKPEAWNLNFECFNILIAHIDAPLAPVSHLLDFFEMLRHWSFQGLLLGSKRVNGQFQRYPALRALAPVSTENIVENIVKRGTMFSIRRFRTKTS